MWARMIAIGVLVLGSALALYKAGKYAAGGTDISAGTSAAVGSLIGALANIIIAIGLYIDF